MRAKSRTLTELPAATAGALETSLQEDVECDALAGELPNLAVPRHEAEALAYIADALVPSGGDRALARVAALIDGQAAEVPQPPSSLSAS